MDKSPIAWGLDIGHSSIKAVKISRDSKGATVMAYVIEPITTSEEVDREEAVVKALGLLAVREEMGNTPVVASVSGRQIFARTINIPVINPKKIARMVELEARQQIPGNFDEVEWGFHLSPAPDGASNDVAIFAAKRDLIDELVKKCKRVGINLVGVSVSSLALYNFVRYDQDFPDDETVIILDVGAENTDLVLYQGETLWMRTLAVSGNDITKAFMKKFRVSFEEAETLKRQIGESRQADKIFKVIEGSLNELTAEVQRSLGFYKQQNANAKLENVVISGNTFRLPNLPQYLADRLRFAIITLEDMEKVQVDQGLDRATFLTDLQSLGVAMGLALQGIGVAKATVNLMPSTLRFERLLKAKRWAAVAVLIMIFASFLVVYFVKSAVLQENSKYAKKIAAYYKESTTSEGASRDVLKQVGPLAKTLRSFDDFGAHKGLSSAVLEGVTGVIQDTVREIGRINPDSPPPEKGGDPELQAAYLERISMPALKFTDTGPFRPLAEPRSVTVEVRIPVAIKDSPAVKDKDLRQAIRNHLQAIPVPEYLKYLNPGPNLFSNVQVVTDRPGEDIYYFVDRGALDEKGDLLPPDKQVQERKIKVNIATYTCTFGGKEVAK